MPHDHHHHAHADVLEKRLGLAVVVNVVLTVVQVIGGLASGSLSLIADGVHNLSDAASLWIALAARRIARRPANTQMPFGYGRAESVAAFANLVSLAVIGIWLMSEALGRLVAPQQIDGGTVMLIAAAALLVDLVTALLTLQGARDSMNIRATFLHNLADAAGSVAVLIAGAFALFLGWTWIDPLITIAIAGYILWLAAKDLRRVIGILMLSSPAKPTADEVRAHLADHPGLIGVSDIALWQLTENDSVLEATLVVRHWDGAEALRDQAAARLRHDLGLARVDLRLRTLSATD